MSLVVALGVAAIVAGALLGQSKAYAETLKELADRQLIILFDPRLAPPSSEEIVAAVTARDPVLTRFLGLPVAATRLLPDVASPELQALLAHDPLSPRALLEQYVVLTYVNEAAALAAFACLHVDPLILSVERNILLSFSVTPTEPQVSETHAVPCQATLAGASAAEPISTLNEVALIGLPLLLLLGAALRLKKHRCPS